MIKITKDNFDHYFPNAKITFKRILHGTFAPTRKMKIGDSFNTMNYLTVDDIEYIMENRIKNYGGKRKEYHTNIWKDIIKIAQDIKE